MTTGTTRLLALLGHPVAHSVSPQVHSAAITAAGLDLAYVAFDVSPGRLHAAVAGLGALGAAGANVTAPHKQAVLGIAEEVTDEAAAVGAANTLLWRDGVLVADNTDAPGLVQVLTRDAGLARGDGVLVLGAGGAALAAAVALGRLGAHVEVVARRPEAARQVGRRVVEAGGTVGEVATPRVALNTTPLGWHGEPLPERFLALGPGQVALDLVYGRPTPFLTAAAARGALALDGLGLLVAQAALSFTRWTGQAAPVDRMRLAAQTAMGRLDKGSGLS
jgi:shikimate dehydrogenase